MKLYLVTILLALLAPAVLAGTEPQKAVMVTYPKDTPNSVIEQAMQAVKDAGGTITHKFELIKGFAATAPAAVLEAVSALSEAFRPWIEEDQIVTIYDKATSGGE
ncbi:hypothetical protein EMCG_05427 [[Emmonsia] crescens]|uniref:Inhibitor I9 domain-containing protein n=1 Tax=[Emmonsia] crescens TaxID=73230 RepID=A0A0G2IXJ4_9EURO|nr:hypothetical protein EMCG_05427 [Emmonsia crescens UAMH 3008]